MDNPIDHLIFLVGFMGSGKTTVGRALSLSIGWSFIDIDEQIVAREARPIPDIFRLRGEPYFRKVESTVLFALADQAKTVVALGGGTFCQPENQVFIKQHGVSIWLHCSLNEILQRLPNDGSRPLFRSPAEVEALLAHRIPFYEQADLKVCTTNRKVDEIVGEILDWMKAHGTIQVRLA